MTYQLGGVSRARLAGVHPKLVQVTERAIQLTTQDFTVMEGLRTLARQQTLVAKGASRTLHSKHLTQPDGYGHAVDLVPFDETPRWEWPLIYPVAFAVQTAALELGVRLVWGGVWDRQLTQLGHSPPTLAAAVRDYAQRHPGDDLLDGPHYQLADV